jgi:hypothetical protein
MPRFNVIRVVSNESTSRFKTNVNIILHLLFGIPNMRFPITSPSEMRSYR